MKRRGYMIFSQNVFGHLGGSVERYAAHLPCAPWHRQSKKASHFGFRIVGLGVPRERFPPPRFALLPGGTRALYVGIKRDGTALCAPGKCICKESLFAFYTASRILILGLCGK
jgi:hypothetical protein